MKLRPGNNQDSEALIALISEVYEEYGDRIFLEDYDKDLLDIESSYLAQGGDFVVLSEQGKIVGCHAAMPLRPEEGIATFRRLYLTKDHRGGQAGTILMWWALDWAREQGFHRVEFWSDTRFERAHSFFEKFGFKNTGRKRDLDDGAAPYSEFEFTLDL